MCIRDSKYSADQPYSRITGAQTFLIPGLQNIGFKLHFLFIYKEALHPYSNTKYAKLIEQKIHESISAKYSTYVMNFASSYKSEWYLPEHSYLDFFDFILGVVSVQDPLPEKSYQLKNSKIFPLSKYRNKAKYTEYKLELENLQKQIVVQKKSKKEHVNNCLLYTSPSPRDRTRSRMPSSA